MIVTRPNVCVPRIVPAQNPTLGSPYDAKFVRATRFDQASKQTDFESDRIERVGAAACPGTGSGAREPIRRQIRGGVEV